MNTPAATTSGSEPADQETQPCENRSSIVKSTSTAASAATSTAEVPVTSSAIPTPRLAPAMVDGRQIWIECPGWCVLDHVAANDRFLEDVYHSGEMIDLEVPRFNGDPMLLAFVRLGLDSFSSKPELRVPFLVLEEGAGSGEGMYMRPEQAEEFADGLEVFAQKVRAMTRSISEGAAS